MRRVVLLALFLAGGLPATAQAWTWPVDGAVLRPFVFGSDPYAAGQHRGIDVAGDLGTNVEAPASGLVSFAGTVPKGGRTLSIVTADGYTVSLQHLGTIGVRKGDTGVRRRLGGHCGYERGPRGRRAVRAPRNPDHR